MLEHVTSDEVLIRAVASGDRDAMRILFGRHHVRVYRFVHRLTNNAAVADDTVSEVFIDVWRQAARFEGRSSVSTWILAMARFKALSAMRRQKEDQLDEAKAEAVPDLADSPETTAVKQSKGMVLRRCLAQLSAEHREVIDLVYYHEKAIDEVAAILAIPENTVKTRMFYARRRLSELLKEAGIDRGWP